MEYLKYEDLNSNNCREKIIKNNYPEFYTYLDENYKNLDTFSEKLYWFYNDIKTRPLCECGKPTKFINVRLGYREFCSNKCVNNSKEITNRKIKSNIDKYGVSNAMLSEKIKTKLKNTNITKYGVENVFQSKDIKTKIKDTNNEKYGVDFPMQNESIREKYKSTIQEKYGVEWNSQIQQVKEQKRLTCLEHFGVDCNFKSQETKDKITETNLARYGTKNPMQSRLIQDKIIKNNLLKYNVKFTKQKDLLKNHPDIIDILEDNIYLCSCENLYCNKCQERNFKIKSHDYFNRKYHSCTLCTKLNPIDKNTYKNTFLEIFVKNILNEYNINYIENDRKILNGLELDIYIPEKQIAIECNGCFWHSDNYKNSSYHYNKFIACHNKDIKLLTIWEDQILNYPEKIKNLILSKLNIFENRLYARKCIIKKITSKEANKLLNETHLQNGTISSYNYGLFYDDRLVEVMTFGKRKTITHENEYELIRCCSKKGYQIIGGASRLLKHFIKEYNPERIISYSSNDISCGELYKKLNFIKESDTKFSYWYINPAEKFKRYHRYNFTKYRLVQNGYDETLSEDEIMKSRGFLKIFDCGQTKYILNLSKQ